MNRNLLLKEIAETGYNILYAAKKHFATYDIVEKAPGWITILTLGIGIFALVAPQLANNYLGAAIITVGIASIYFNKFQDERSKYAEVGNELINYFNELRSLYGRLQSLKDDEGTEEIERIYRDIRERSSRTWVHKHIFLSDWYTHYKIFWQAQIGWLDEQLHFRFWRDKIPLSLTLTGCLFLAALLSFIIYQYHFCAVAA